MPVNALLWRALWILPHLYRLMMLIHLATHSDRMVCTGRSTIQKLKLAVFVVGLELRSDAIQVRAYVQVRSADRKEWITAGRDKILAATEDLMWPAPANFAQLRLAKPATRTHLAAGMTHTNHHRLDASR